ncbi:MAG: hypothetical protein ABMA02_10240 [Saprospiraceae bacterium]
MSSSSKIEAFVRSNREAFDFATPAPYCWPGVTKVLDRFRHADQLEQYLVLNRFEFDTAEPAERVWQAIAESLYQHKSDRNDPLETFILDNRAAFDSEIPGDRIWAAIEQSVPAKAAKTVAMNWRANLLRAAAAIALLIAGINIGIWYGASDAAQAGMSMSDVSTEYAELEQYYQRDISTKEDKLTKYASYSDKNVLDDLRQMDGIMTELRTDLANVPPGNREQVVRAMIENYKAKAAILERVLEHIEQQQPNQQQQVPTNSSNYEVENL